MQHVLVFLEGLEQMLVPSWLEVKNIYCDDIPTEKPSINKATTAFMFH